MDRSRICKNADGKDSFGISFSTSTSACDVAPRTARCCALWNRIYEVEVLDSAPRSGEAHTAFTIRREGFFYRPVP